MDAVRMLFGRPVKPRIDGPTVAPVTASELDGLRREGEGTAAKVKELAERLAGEQASLVALRQRLGELIHGGEDGAEVLADIRLIEDRVRGLELALSLAQQKQDQALTALTDLTKQAEAAKYAQAMERLKRDALKIDEALDTLEQSCTQAATSMLTIQQLRAGHAPSFIVTCRLELQRFADIAISPLTGIPRPPSRMMKYSRWSESIPAVTEHGGSRVADGQEVESRS